jgi:hypothetical protein
MTNYNGWTNYATWRVNLEMFDGLEAEEMGWNNLDAYDLSETLKEYAKEILDNDFQGKKYGDVPLAFSYALAFISEVNWAEIARHILDLANEE